MPCCTANPSTWEVQMRYQPGGVASLLANMSAVVVKKSVLQVPADMVLDVPAYSVIRIDKAEANSASAAAKNPVARAI